MKFANYGEFLRYYYPNLVGTQAHGDIPYDPNLEKDAKKMAGNNGGDNAWVMFYRATVETIHRWPDGYNEELEIDT